MSDAAVQVIQKAEDISLPELKRGLADGSIILIDVREQDEWDAGHIAEATLNPLSRFAVSKLPVWPGKKVVLICRSGRRSLQALERAQAAGRTDINSHFSGGMLAWEAAGEPVVK